ncbi:uncharacterized protein CLAFUR5_05627 [Fulvia fulva]|uniref:Endosomal spry domain-containing protein n=1 Tax=Passalora fulva TaxID=5499 RepID=A0A9Q8LHB2_PASFU|nr:uncharacterized protein CLAFUR5_05627 [Fulvia fulva]KAK4625489.1 hypothetical protein CLAFUR0_05486 [Fulvia fulva]UJO17437.1 hypothetical protein CLAFUR5_05627 [Fulvia fulva]
MAPAPPVLGFLLASRTAKTIDSIPDIQLSSLELDQRDTTAHNLFRRASSELVPRADSNAQHGSGAIDPSTIKNGGFFALFAILGVAMVLASIWFFFWAKNGGFQFQQGDWDDYKSTVLRRKGPDGKTLSNATKSTKLGGGTIAGSQHYAWAKNAARSVVGKDEKGRKGVMAKRGWAKTHSITYSDDFTDTLGTRTVYSDEMTEARTEPDLERGHGHHSRRYRDRDVRQYKKERPARVGGLNREADGSHFDYTNTDRSDVMTETVLTESSDQPMLPKTDERREKEKQRAERKAREEAKRMERRWKREAEEAAAALARESSSIPPPPPSHARKSSSPHKNPSAAHKTRRDRDRASSRSSSPKKRDFSYNQGPESEILSTAYTQSTSSGQRTSSYYDEYRPRASDNPRYSREFAHSERERSGRQSSPRKKQGGARSGGYRRGGTDSDLE